MTRVLLTVLDVDGAPTSTEASYAEFPPDCNFQPPEPENRRAMPERNDTPRSPSGPVLNVDEDPTPDGGVRVSLVSHGVFVMSIIPPTELDMLIARLEDHRDRFVRERDRFVRELARLEMERDE